LRKSVDLVASGGFGSYKFDYSSSFCSFCLLDLSILAAISSWKTWPFGSNSLCSPNDQHPTTLVGYTARSLTQSPRYRSILPSHR
jgi:hypothetical protein